MKRLRNKTGLLLAAVLATAFSANAEPSEFASSLLGTDSFRFWTDSGPSAAVRENRSSPSEPVPVREFAKYSSAAATYGVCGKSWCHEMPLRVSSSVPYGRCVPISYREAKLVRVSSSDNHEQCRNFRRLPES